MPKKKAERNTGLDHGLKLVNGIYHYQFQHDGVRYKASCKTGNLKEAERRKTERYSQIVNRDFDIRDNNTYTFRKAYQLYREVEAPRISPRVLKDTDYLAQAHWTHFMDSKLRDMQSNIDWLHRNLIIEKKMSANSAYLIFSKLKQVLELSRRRGFHSVPLEYPKIAQTRDPKITLNSEQIITFFVLVDEHALSLHESIILRACYYMGMRIGEAVNLQWDLYSETALTYKIKEQKNGTKEYMPVTPEMAMWLAKLERKPGELICPGRFSGVHGTDYTDKVLKKIDGIMGLQEPITAHRLRASMCVNLIREGTPIAEVSKICRHANINTTMKYYAELELEDKRRGLSNLKSAEKEPDSGNIIQFRVG